MHERSHGESVIDLMTHRFGGRGLYVLDEPEAALSVRGCLVVLRRVAEVPYDAAEPVALTRNFLSEPDRFLRHLLD